MRASPYLCMLSLVCKVQCTTVYTTCIHTQLPLNSLRLTPANYTYNLTLMVQSWWEGQEYYDYSTASCGEDDDDNNNNRRKRKDDDKEEFDECQSYTQVE